MTYKIRAYSLTQRIFLSLRRGGIWMSSFWENYLNVSGLLGKRAIFLLPVIQHICNYAFLFGYPVSWVAQPEII